MSEALPLPSIPDEVPIHQRLAARAVLGSLARAVPEGLTVELPDGSSFGSGNVAVRIEDWRFFWRALTGGDIGIGEAYMAGEWTCNDLVAVCRLALAKDFRREARGPFRMAQRLETTLRRLVERNDSRRSAENARAHYDLGNEFYRLFLDDSMTYSCALFERTDVTLTEAQPAKLDRVCRLLDLGPGTNVLEIGTGWGSFALHAASNYGCHVTTLTLSEEQHALTGKKVAIAGLQDRIDVRLCDYRDARGVYDRIVSIEMLEAVGYEHFGTFFSRSNDLLRPGGRMFLQSITIPDQHFDSYRRSFDWIRKHIFPGGLLPSLYEIERALKEHTSLNTLWLENIGPHYAKTLHEWRERFLDRRRDVRALGFDERFIRMWDFYLASCEAAFAVGFLGDLQLLLEKRTP